MMSPFLNIHFKVTNDHVDVWCFTERRAIQHRTAKKNMNAIGYIMRSCRLRWHEHVERKGDESVVEEIASVGKSEKDWPNIVSADIRLVGLELNLHDHVNWRA